MEDLNRILHIEDDPEIAQITGMALELIGGFTLLHVDRGEKALAVLQDFAPDLILSDVQMPGLTGPETLEKIRKVAGYERVPTIYLTARMGAERDGLLSHAMDLAVIGKPFEVTTLSDEIREIWGRTIAKAA
ncbi:response regulator receiver protein [Sulfitobacter brevis]|uniref:Response regulator receiver protein n=1 Tax=Sulfitobacter brevis TaxID=74348 RepID=A0A1I2DWX0_9RHOB|nr:response regulator [Sulfitobacter brevis]SFE84938.1 response regulator receiver protein [Sulfitobacter brevis]